MGNPALRRNVRLHVLISPEELESLEMQADAFGMTKSEFVRFALEAVSASRLDSRKGTPSLVYIDAETWRLILTEFRLQGSNLNQAARACNKLARMLGPYMRHERPDAEEMREFARTLREVRNDLALLIGFNLEFEERIDHALSLDSLIKIDRGWHHARAQD